MIPKDLLCTADGDLDFTLGSRLTPDLVTYVVQRLRQRLRFFLGEWFLDLRLGIPYFERVFIAAPDLELLTGIYRKVILRTTGVGGLDSLVLRFEKRERILFVTFRARCQDGSIVEFRDEPFVLDTRELREAA